jgi:hypothetical protein
MQWWWDPMAARTALQSACFKLVTDLAPRRSGQRLTISLGDIAGLVSAQEGSVAVVTSETSTSDGVEAYPNGGIGILPVVSLELSFAFASAVFSILTSNSSQRSHLQVKYYLCVSVGAVMVIFNLCIFLALYVISLFSSQIRFCKNCQSRFLSSRPSCIILELSLRA